jgi:hypothetical protein
MDQFRQLRGFDWNGHLARSNGHRTTDRGRGQAFDAAGSSGFGFLQSQLELIDPNIVEPLQETTHARDIVIKNGGGFPEQISVWATNYASTGGAFYGLQGTNNTDIAQAQVDIEKGVWPTFNWSSGFSITYVDLQRMKFAQSHGNTPPVSLQQMYDASVSTIWAKAMDYLTYIGFLGYPGLINNPAVPASYAVSGGSGTAWSTKTPSQILDDVNFGINQTVENSGYSIAQGSADTLLIPYNQFAYLSRPMTIGGVGFDSTISYIKKNCVFTQYFGGRKEFNIQPLPNQWIAGTTAGSLAGGLGSSDRAVFYRNDEKSVMLHVPTPKQPAMTIPTDKGPGYSTFFVGCISSVIFKRASTFFYLDGV